MGESAIWRYEKWETLVYMQACSKFTGSLEANLQVDLQHVYRRTWHVYRQTCEFTGKSSGTTLMCDFSSTVCLMLCLHDYDGNVLLQDRVGFDGMCTVQNGEGWVLMACVYVCSTKWKRMGFDGMCVCVQYKMEKDGF